MSADRTYHWIEGERALLTGLLDEIIPASSDGRVPSAGALGVADFVIGKLAEESVPDGIVRAALSHFQTWVNEAGGEFSALQSGTRIAIVRRLETAEPEFFSLLIRYTYMGYYSRPDVRPLFGLSNQPTQPNGYDVPSESPEFMAELTEPVRKRGPVYRAG